MRPYPIRQKDPMTSRVIPFDFSDHLAPGDAIVAPATVISPGLAAIAVVDSPYVRVRLTGGTHGDDIIVKCAVPTAAGHTVALSLLVEIREGAN
jgi:hypothetical protein